MHKNIDSSKEYEIYPQNFSRKTILINGNTIFQWVGDAACAERAFIILTKNTAILDDSEIRIVDFLRDSNQFSKEDLTKFDFIVSRFSGSQKSQKTNNAYSLFYPNDEYHRGLFGENNLPYSIKISGRDKNRFLDLNDTGHRNFKLEPDEVSVANLAIRRSFRQLASEIASKKPKDIHLWYGIFANIGYKTFRELSCAIFIWDVESESEYKISQMYYSKYRDDFLFINRLDRAKDKDGPNPWQSYVVPLFHNFRNYEPMDDDIQFTSVPDVEVHVVRYKGGKTALSYSLGGNMIQDLNVNRGAVKFSLSKSFLRKCGLSMASSTRIF